MSFPWANEYTPKVPLMKWIDERLPLPRLVYNAVGSGYPVPRNLNYFWNFGVLSGLALVIQQGENYQTGTVQSVGPGRPLGNGRVVPIDLKAGDRVLYLKHAANMVKAGADMVILPHAEVLAVLED